MDPIIFVSTSEHRNILNKDRSWNSETYLYFFDYNLIFGYSQWITLVKIITI